MKPGQSISCLLHSASPGRSVGSTWLVGGWAMSGTRKTQASWHQMVVAQQWQSPPGSRATDLPCPQHFILDSAFRSNARSSNVDLFFPNSQPMLRVPGPQAHSLHAHRQARASHICPLGQRDSDLSGKSASAGQTSSASTRHEGSAGSPEATGALGSRGSADPAGAGSSSPAGAERGRRTNSYHAVRDGQVAIPDGALPLLPDFSQPGNEQRVG